MKQETQGGTPATPQEQAHLDDVKRTEPMETTEQCVMSRKEAASVLMDMAGGGGFPAPNLRPSARRPLPRQAAL